MTQYDDPYTPSSGPRGRLVGAAETGSIAPTQEAHNRYSQADGSDQGASLNGPTVQGVTPNKPVPSDWLSRTSLTSRRRNQWRQFKQMTPDFGTSTLDHESEVAPSATPPREASLPSFNSKPGIEGAASSSPITPSRSKRPSPGRPLPMAAPSSPAMSQSGSPSPRPQARVTPLRPLPQQPQARSTVLASTPASAKSSVAIPTSLAPTRPGGSPRRSRDFAPQRRLTKLPLPALYLIRLTILGVGVATIAGTLLSVLSPSNVAAPTSTTNGTSAPAAKTSGRALVSGQRATTVADLNPTTELTRLKAQLEQLATLTPGLIPALYALDLDSGRYVDLEGSKVVAAASMIKVPILVAFLQQVDAGAIALNQTLVLQEHQVAGGSGAMANDALGTEYTALDVATRMIIHSDNTATNMMIDALGGQEALNQQFAAWGLTSTVLRNPLPDLEGTNTTSARDLASLMALIDQGGVLSPRSRDRLFAIMQRTVNRSLIPFSLTDGSIVANKTGDIAAALGDVALVDTPNGQRYVLAMMVQRPNNDGRASELIRRLTETTHTEFNQPIAPVGRPSASPTDEPNSTEPSSPRGPKGNTPDGAEAIPDSGEAEPPTRSGPASAQDQIPPG